VTESEFCASCGTQIPRAASFCGNCGAKAHQTEETTEGAAFSFSPQGQRIANELSSIQARLRALQVLNAVMDDVRQLWKADLHAIELAKASGSVAEVQRDFSPGWVERNMRQRDGSGRTSSWGMLPCHCAATNGGWRPGQEDSGSGEETVS